MTDTDRVFQRLQKLKRLAEDAKGTPEGEAARHKIEEIVAKYPDLRPAMVPVWELKLRDIGFMNKRGISTDGSWEGRDIWDAFRKMQEEYCRRIIAFIITRDFDDFERRAFLTGRPLNMDDFSLGGLLPE